MLRANPFTVKSVPTGGVLLKCLPPFPELPAEPMLWETGEMPEMCVVVVEKGMGKCNAILMVSDLGCASPSLPPKRRKMWQQRTEWAGFWKRDDVISLSVLIRHIISIGCLLFFPSSPAHPRNRSRAHLNRWNYPHRCRCCYRQASPSWRLDNVKSFEERMFGFWYVR